MNVDFEILSADWCPDLFSYCGDSPTRMSEARQSISRLAGSTHLSFEIIGPDADIHYQPYRLDVKYCNRRRMKSLQ